MAHQENSREEEDKESIRFEPFKLERYFAKHEFTASYLLCCSDVQSMSIRFLFSLPSETESPSIDNLLDLKLGYTETRGAPTLRSSIADNVYAGTGITADDILVHVGAEEAIFTFLAATLKKGDHVIVQTPCYESLTELPKTLGCDVTPWKTRLVRDTNNLLKWELAISDLARLTNEHTKLIIINWPNNPTGFVGTPTQQAQLVQFANARGIMVFADEVYRELGVNPLPSFAALGNHCVALNVMSKAYGLPGLRLGWLACRDRNVLAKAAVIKDYTTLCAPAPSELITEAALAKKSAIPMAGSI